MISARTASRAEVQRLKDLANGRMFDVLAGLGVRERPRAGGYISLCNPMRKDTSPSLTIWTKGGFLAFKDHADEAVRGDVIQLVAYLKGWSHLPHGGFREALDWLEDRLGVKALSRDRRERLARDARRAIEHAETSAAKDAADRRRQARKIFFDGLPVLGSPVETYLREARGIDLAAAPFVGPRGGSLVPGCLRFVPRLKHIDQKTRVETFWPAMVAACVDYGGHVSNGQQPARAGKPGNIAALHRTWLAPDGRGKAPVAKAKMVLGGFAGCVIPLWRGGSGLPVAEAIAHGLVETVALTEGIEDGLTVAAAQPAHRTWAVIALGNLGQVPALPSIDSVIVHRQNDWLKLQAVESFETGLRALAAHGWPVAEVKAFSGKDVNDTLRGA